MQTHQCHWQLYIYREQLSHVHQLRLMYSFGLRAALAGAGYKVISDLDGLTNADLSAGESIRSSIYHLDLLTIRARPLKRAS
jgi:hypothetical protein